MQTSLYAQLESALGGRYRLLALDLPGHGASDDAPVPEKSYTIPGYADMAREVLQARDVAEAVIVGWSLGGHIGLEMVARGDSVRGLLISGTPPLSLSPEAMAEAFLPNPQMALAGQETFSDEEAEVFARTTSGNAGEMYPALLAAVRRCDGRARKFMLEAALAGKGHDQRRTVETSKLPLAVINGAEDPFINNKYVVSLDYAGLWRGKVHILEGLGHAPFLEDPAVFNPILESFLADITG